MADEQTKRSVWPIVAGLAFLPVLYVLSTGPAWYFFGEEAYLWPLNWAVDNGPEWFRKLATSYREFWRTVP
jgi:hypothetical protein